MVGHLSPTLSLRSWKAERRSSSFKYSAPRGSRTAEEIVSGISLSTSEFKADSKAESPRHKITN